MLKKSVYDTSLTYINSETVYLCKCILAAYNRFKGREYINFGFGNPARRYKSQPFKLLPPFLNFDGVKYLQKPIKKYRYLLTPQNTNYHL